MTASRYKLPASFANLAGQKFGINLLDLFKDDEEGSSETSGFLPQFSTTVVEKGRGGVLGYKAPRTPTRESTFELAPQLPGQGGTSVNIGDVSASASTSQKETEEEKEPELPKRESLGSIASKWGQTALFGGQDYFKALEAGYKPEEIRSYLEQNPSMLHETNRPGQTSGLYEQISRGNVTQPSEYFTPQQYLDRQIEQQRAQSNQSSQQNYQTVSTPSAPSISTQYGASAEYLGHKDIEAAKAGGMSDQQIAQVIKANVSKLREGNLPGGGGLYDQYAKYM